MNTDFQKIYNSIQEPYFEIIKVKGHSIDPFNIFVDKLATKAGE